jgi:mitogen-activated protein kinase kinase 9
VNPNNVHVNSNRDVKISDFSKSKIVKDITGEPRRIAIVVGMTAYKSLERFEPKPARAAPAAADVWGFGVTMMGLFLGHHPFFPSMEYPPYEKLREAICNTESSLVPEAVASSEELQGFVATCLHKDPRRHATVAQLLAH